MPQRTEVSKALRFLKQNPRIPEKGIRYIGKKLRETEENEGETEKLLGSAFQYLQKRRAYPTTHPLMRNIGRLGRSLRK